jgi:hypothetical protein
MVSCAAAKVTRDCFSNFLLAGRRILLEKRNESHQDARSAETALQPMRFPKCFLQRMQLSLFEIIIGGQTFDGCYFPSVDLNREYETGTDRNAIKKNCARPAHPLLTSDMCSGQGQVMAQEVTKQESRFDPSLVAFSIYID